MANKKKETMLEKAEDTIKKAAGKVVKEVKDVEEKVVEEAKEIEEKIVDAVKGKKKTTKKEEKKDDSKDDKKAKLKALMEKAKALEEGVEEVGDIDLKSKVKNEQEEKEDTLVPMEDYLKSSIHLGTKVITPDMKDYVYRRRADGLAVFNTALLDDKIREGAEYLAKYAPEDVVVVCKREAGWKAVSKFSEVTGIQAFTKKYPAGVLTNSQLEDFFETDLVFICDPWIDKNALNDANRIKIPVLSICDTNNYTRGINQIIPGNNKSAKSIGMIFYLLTKLYIEARKLKVEAPPIQEFVEGWDALQPPK